MLNDGEFNEALRQLRNNEIIVCDISLSDIADDKAKLLAKALANNDTLIDIDISHNNIGDEGVISIAEGGATISTLVKLSCLNNHFGPKGVNALNKVILQASSNIIYAEYAGLSYEDDCFVTERLELVESLSDKWVEYKDNDGAMTLESSSGLCQYRSATKYILSGKRHKRDDLVRCFDEDLLNISAAHFNERIKKYALIMAAISSVDERAHAPEIGYLCISSADMYSYKSIRVCTKKLEREVYDKKYADEKREQAKQASAREHRMYTTALIIYVGGVCIMNNTQMMDSICDQLTSIVTQYLGC